MSEFQRVALELAAGLLFGSVYDTCLKDCAQYDPIMRSKYLRESVLFQRWSFLVPLIGYVVFFCLIYILSVPLQSIKKSKFKRAANTDLQGNPKNDDGSFGSKKNVEQILLNEKNQYLVNINDNENKYKNSAEILQDVFKR